MKRGLKATLAVLLLVAVGWWLWRAWQAPYAALARELQALREAGELLRYEDIVPPVPPHLNAAPLYEKAFAAIPKLTRTEEEQIFAVTVYKQIRDPEQVRKLLARSRSALLLVKQASRYPHLRLVRLAPDFFSPEFRHLSKMRTLARLLSVEAMYHLHMGNTDGAWDNVAVLLRVMKQLSQEPFAVHVMNICALFTMVRNIVCAIPARQGITPSRARELLHILGELDGDRLLLQSLRLERLEVGISFFEWLRANPKWAREAATMWIEGCVISNGANLAGWVLPLDRQLVVNQLIVLRYYRQLVQIAQKGEPYEWQVFEAMDEAAKRITKQGVTFGSFVFRPLEMAGMFLRVEGLVPEYAGSGFLFHITAKLKAHQRILQVIPAAHLYRREHGQFPNNLEALVPRYLPAVPKDPFDGQPLRYRCENGALRIWSVGSDLKKSEKDIVWTIQP